MNDEDKEKKLDDEEGLFDWQPHLVEGRDYYMEEGKMVLTEAYLRRRGTCCHNGCRHCPYGEENGDKKQALHHE